MLMQRPTWHASKTATLVSLSLRELLAVQLLFGVLLLQACTQLPEWLKSPRAQADSTGKVVVDCRDAWPLNAQESSCAEEAFHACGGSVIYMRTVNSSGPADVTSLDGLSDFRVVYQCRRNVEGY